MNQMKSFGLWYRLKRKGKIIPDFDVHINLWDIVSGKNTEEGKIPFIDFGIKIIKFQDTADISFSIPFSIKKEELLDLSHVLESDEVQLIFNDITYNYGEMVRPYNGITNDKERIMILPLKKGLNDELVSQVEIDAGSSNENNKNTTVRIKLNQYGNVFKNVTSVYFRFRIISPSVGNLLISKLQERNYFLESAFEERQIIDIKFNNARNIDKYDISYYARNNFDFAKFKSVHLFVMVPSFYEVTIWDNFSECRLLEKGGWSKYLQGLETSDVIAYHWKKKDATDLGLNDFTQLIKISNRARNMKIILIYCFIVVALGAMGSGLFWIIQKVLGF